MNSRAFAQFLLIVKQHYFPEPDDETKPANAEYAGRKQRKKGQVDEATMQQAIEAHHLSAGAFEKAIDVVQHNCMPICTDGTPHTRECREDMDTSTDKTLRLLRRVGKPPVLETAQTSESEKETEDARIIEETLVPAIASPRHVERGFEVPSAPDTAEEDEGIENKAPANHGKIVDEDVITPRHAAKRTESEIQNALTHFPFSNRRRRRPLYTKEDAKRYKFARLALEEEADRDEHKE